MSLDKEQELQRILAMIEEGKLTPVEGEQLISSLEQRGRTIHCPFCAETIPAGLGACPECRSSLVPAPGGAGPATGSPPRSGGGFQALPGLGKFLVVYMFAVCLIVLLSSLRFGPSLRSAIPVAMSGLGIIAGVLLCKNNRKGWGLAMLWSGLQIPVVVVHGTELTKQFLHIGIIFTSNLNGTGINLVGIILLILFIVAKKKTMASAPTIA